MEKLILILYAYSKSNGASYSENAEVGSKEELENVMKEFEKNVEFPRYYMESCLSSASRSATEDEMKWLDEADIGFDGCNNDAEQDVLSTKEKTENLLLHYARSIGHTDPKDELEHGLHSLVNNLLIDLMNYCGESMVREQMEEAAGHHAAEQKEKG